MYTCASGYHPPLNPLSFLFPELSPRPEDKAIFALVMPIWHRGTANSTWGMDSPSIPLPWLPKQYNPSLGGWTRDAALKECKACMETRVDVFGAPVSPQQAHDRLPITPTLHGGCHKTHQSSTLNLQTYSLTHTFISPQLVFWGFLITTGPISNMYGVLGAVSRSSGSTLYSFDMTRITDADDGSSVREHLYPPDGSPPPEDSDKYMCINIGTLQHAFRTELCIHCQGGWKTEW